LVQAIPEFEHNPGQARDTQDTDAGIESQLHGVFLSRSMSQRPTPNCPIKLSTVVETQFTVNATQMTVNAIRDQLVTSQVLQGTHTHATDQEAIPYRPAPTPSPRFTGRLVYLSRLRLYFSAEAAAQRRQFLLYGMGGAGKTQICLKFAEESSDLLVSVPFGVSVHAHCHV
jgi:hypothetical protein